MSFKHFSVYVLSILNIITVAPIPQGPLYFINPSVSPMVRPSASELADLSRMAFGFSGYMPQFYSPVGEITIIYTGLNPPGVIPFGIPSTFLPNEPSNIEAENDSSNSNINSSDGTQWSEVPIQDMSIGSQNNPISETMGADIRSGSISNVSPPSGISSEAESGASSFRGQKEDNFSDQNGERPSFLQRTVPESRISGPVINPSYNTAQESTQGSMNLWPTQHNPNTWPTPNNPNTWPTQEDSWPAQDNFDSWPARTSLDSYNPSTSNNRNLFNTPNPSAPYETTSDDSSNFGAAADTSFNRPIPFNSASNFRSENAANGYASAPFDMRDRWPSF